MWTKQGEEILLPSLHPPTSRNNYLILSQVRVQRDTFFQFFYLITNLFTLLLLHVSLWSKINEPIRLKNASNSCVKFDAFSRRNGYFFLINEALRSESVNFDGFKITFLLRVSVNYKL